MRIAVDIGGTFTDLAAFDEDGQVLAFGKALSTYGALVEGIEHTVDDAGVELAKATLFLHGSTVVINNLLERTGAKSGLITTRGFRDIYEIGRINRPDAYNLQFKKHQPLVPRRLRCEIDERLLFDGSVETPLDESSVLEAIKFLRDEEVEAVAIVLLHSYKNSAHEQRVKQLVQEQMPGAFVTASHELSQEYREFERTSTTAANAYVGPRVAGYLGEIEDKLQDRQFGGSFLAVQSTGGLFSVDDARRKCVNMLESGPAGGVVGVQAICRQTGQSDAIAFDMGGTTAKAGLIQNGAPLTTSSARIGAYGSDLPIQIPMIDIFEVGTGGGSIARVEQGRALRVGPRSAGSMPGPACYGRGGENPTVTDANLVLGRLDPDHFLGGAMKLDYAAAERAVREKIADPLGLSVQEAAEGILKIAATTMSYAVKGVTTERGLDPAAFAMYVYGGAGPLHASAIAREIGVRRVIIPASPGHFSAYGMLFSELRYDFVRSVFAPLSNNLSAIDEVYTELETSGQGVISEAGASVTSIKLVRSADMRYVGQEHAVSVDLPETAFRSGDAVAAIKAAFDAEHLQRYGTNAPEEKAEFVSLRVTAFGKMTLPQMDRLPDSGPRTDAEAIARTKPVHFGIHGTIETPVFVRTALRTGNEFAGPALIEEHASTTVVWPTDCVVIDGYGNLIIEVGDNK
ncbi:hydantoinase/oxoprolinase family protein [Pelagibacterium sp.]|uniref:hydantoinase/oxoprolinase family protein n=1 Tax=Pelagibacterium sp. TaxID=1967288 RepID=UPI003A90FBC9